MKQINVDDLDLAKVQQASVDEFSARDARPVRVRIRTVNADAQLTATDGVVVAKPAGANLTVTLPSPVSTTGILFRVKHGGASSNVIVTSAVGVNGVAAGVTLVAGNATSVISDGQNYWSV